LVNDLVTFNTTVTVLNSGVFANGYVSANLGFKEHGRTTPAGEWVNAKASFANTDFTGGGSMTWDVSSTDLVTFKYMLIGTTYFIDVYVDTSTIAGTPATQLFVKIPGGFLPAVKKQSGAAGFDNGVGVVTYTRVDVANNKIEIGKSDLTNWTASSNNTYVRVSMFFEVQ